MSPWRALICILLPPLAVLDKGCGMAIIVGLLWMAGGIPGIIAAFAINLMDTKSVKQMGSGRFVQIPVQHDSEIDDNAEFEKPKRKGAYVRLADGEVAEVIDDDGQMPDMRKLKDE